MTQSPDYQNNDNHGRSALTFAESVVETMRDPLLVLDSDHRIQMASRSFCRTFCVGKRETEGRLIYDLGDGQWDIPELRRLLEEILPKNSHVGDRWGRLQLSGRSTDGSSCEHIEQTFVRRGYVSRRKRRERALGHILLRQEFLG